MWLLKGNECATSDIMTQQWNKYAHLKNNAKCNLSLNMKKGVCHYMKCTNFFFKFQCNQSYMKSWTLSHPSTPNASTITMQNMPKNKNIFVFLL